MQDKVSTTQKPGQTITKTCWNINLFTHRVNIKHGHEIFKNNDQTKFYSKHKLIETSNKRNKEKSEVVRWISVEQ
jgi:hypothetical protein